MPESIVCVLKSDGTTDQWLPQTIDRLGKDEQFLEDVIANNPSLLGIESRATGIYGPMVPFRQLTFHTPQGRIIRPDILFLTASGHPVIVEVKLHRNAELHDRRVIAQTVDYAASFAALDSQKLLGLFDDSSEPTGSWDALTGKLFPDEPDLSELADVLVQRFKSGEVHLIVACDKAPDGLREMVEGVAVQNALGFGFGIVELRPYCREGTDEIMFFQNTAAETVIVNRTSVTVTVEEGAAQPGVDVVVDSARRVEDEIERSQKQSRKSYPQTLVNQATRLLRTKLGGMDLEGTGILNLSCWHGYDLWTHLYLPDESYWKIDIQFMQFCVDDGVSETGEKTILVDLYVQGTQDRAARLENLLEHVVGFGDSLRGMANVPVESANTENGIRWAFSSSSIQSPWTPESLSDWMLRICRLLAEKLPLKSK